VNLLKEGTKRREATQGTKRPRVGLPMSLREARENASEELKEREHLRAGVREEDEEDDEGYADAFNPNLLTSRKQL
jgi:hypothetical protein